MTPPCHVALADARLAPNQPGRGSALLLAHGSMELRWYAPVGVDRQTPHAQDEIYIVAQGSGTLVRDGVRHPFVTGDALFVPAGMAHRFEDFTPGFATWVLFWGPEGGEAGAGS